MLGELVVTLVDVSQGPGVHTATWNAESNASGIYFYRLSTDDYTSTRKMLLLK